MHEHGAEEELFYVLSGRGISLQGRHAWEVRDGDCTLYRPRRGGHTLHALEPMDVLAFGPRTYDEAVGFPRLGLSLVGRRAVVSVPGAEAGAPLQFVREAEAGPPELPEEIGERPPSVVNLADVEPERVTRPRVTRERRNLGAAVESLRTGLQHVTLAPGSESAPPHCHSHEEELFVILDGSGTLMLGLDTESALRPGQVIARPAGTRVAHMFRAGEEGMRLLAYGTREPGDVCYYPRSNKISFRGLGLIGRLEPLDYWDGED
jgi:uncharacterized cupin superfamily protein